MCKSQMSMVHKPTTREASAFLDLLCSSTTAIAAHASSKQSMFHLDRPTISLSMFSERLETYYTSVPSVVACVYLGRLFLLHPGLFCGNSVNKLLLTALTVATKFSEDRCMHQRSYAACGAITTNELNALESEFLHLLGFRAFVTPFEYEEMSERLVGLRAKAPTYSALLPYYLRHQQKYQEHKQQHQQGLQHGLLQKQQHILVQHRTGYRKRGSHNIMLGRTVSYRAMSVPLGPHT